MTTPTRFFPKQVLRRIDGADFASLSVREHAALRYFLRRGRKQGVALAIGQAATVEQLHRVPSGVAQVAGSRGACRVRVLSA